MKRSRRIIIGCVCILLVLTLVVCGISFILVKSKYPKEIQCIPNYAVPTYNARVLIDPTHKDFLSDFFSPISNVFRYFDGRGGDILVDVTDSEGDILKQGILIIDEDFDRYDYEVTINWADDNTVSFRLDKNQKREQEITFKLP